MVDAEDDKLDIDYHLNLSKFDINVGMAMLIGSIVAFLTIMFKAITSEESNNSPIFALYFNIVIVLISVYSMKAYGILVAAISAVLFCLTLKNFTITEINIIEFGGNVIANVIQAIIIWLVLYKFKEFSFMQKNEIVNDRFKILLVLTGIIYVIVSVIKLINKDIENLNDLIFIIILFIAIIILLYLIEDINRRISNSLFLLLICIIPGFIAALINFAFSSFFVDGWWQNFILWMGSNFILLSTFGYVLLCIFSNKKNAKKHDAKTLISVKVPILLYYISIMLWNLLFFIMYSIGWLKGYTIIYIFPWLIGNLLFISNFVLSQNNEFDFDEIKEKKERFKWFEGRAVTAENNTTIIMNIVVIALPIITTITKNIGTNTITIFVLNISAAIASIALIWVPQSNIKFMSFLKTLKTILHLFSISLLLLSSIMIMSDSFSGLPPKGY